ncbi:unnamed protein product [Arctogadus glacialis]
MGASMAHQAACRSGDDGSTPGTETELWVSEPDGPRTIHCSTGPPKTYLKKSTIVSHLNLTMESTLAESEDAPETKSQKKEDKYPLTGKPTGLCLIINNENFQDGTKRRGTQKDAESLADVFSWLGFQVLMCKDQTASDMARVTKLLADLKYLKDLRMKDLLDRMALTLKGLMDMIDLMDLIYLRQKNPNNLMDLMDLKDLKDLKDLMDLMDLMDLRQKNLKDLMDLMDLRQKNLKDLMDLMALRQKNLGDLRLMNCTDLMALTLKDLVPLTMKDLMALTLKDLVSPTLKDLMALRQKNLVEQRRKNLKVLMDPMALIQKYMVELRRKNLKVLMDPMALMALRQKNLVELRRDYHIDLAKLSYMVYLKKRGDLKLAALKQLELVDLKNMADLAGPKHLPDLADLAHLAGLQKCKLEEWSNGRFTPLSRLRCLGLAHGDAFVCCVLSHGDEDVVSGVDGKTLPISDITSAFNGEHCPALIGKPKVFFIQACQGPDLHTGWAVDDLWFHRQKPEADKGRQTKKEHHPKEADYLVSKATVAKYPAYRDEKRGSYFIQSLCEQLRKGCARGEDILKILVRVNADVSNQDFGCDPKDAWKQMPEFRATLRHDLVFLP